MTGDEELRRLYLLQFLLLIGFISACSIDNDNNSDVIINKAELSPFENSLMSLIGDYTGVFDLQINNENAKLIEITIDSYEYGEKQEEIMLFNSYLDGLDLSKATRVLVSKRPYGKQSQWIASIISDDGIAGMESGLISEKQYSGTAFGTISMPSSFTLGEKKVISTLALTDADSVHIQSDIENEEDLKEATDYEQVYIINISVK